MRLRTLDDFRREHLASFEKMGEDIAKARHAASAEGFAEHLIAQIREFVAELDDLHEVGIRLVTFGQTTTFHVSQIGFVEPNLIIFDGLTEDSSPVRLVQHLPRVAPRREQTCRGSVPLRLIPEFPKSSEAERVTFAINVA